MILNFKDHPSQFQHVGHSTKFNRIEEIMTDETVFEPEPSESLVRCSTK